MTAPNLSALRLLILSPCQPHSTTDTSSSNIIPSPFPALLAALTSTPPSSDIASFAGYTSHPPLRLKTKYYDRHVGIWCDELPPVSAPRTQSRRSTASSGTTEQQPSSPSASRIPRTDALPSSPTKSSISSPTRATPTSPIQDAPIDGPPAESQPEELEVVDPVTIKTWKSQMLSPIAGEVLASIGAIILILPIPDSPLYPSTPAEKVGLMEYISAVNEVKDAIEDLGRDVGTLFLLQPAIPKKADGPMERRKVLKRLDQLVETFEDKSHEMGVFGWDFVSWDGVPEASEGVPKLEVESDGKEDKNQPTRNEYGEKLGIDRVREVLEGVDWSVSPSQIANMGGEDEDGVGEGNEGDNNFDVFGGEKYKGLDAELQQEMMGLKISMMDPEGDRTDARGAQEGEDMSADQMSALMERVVAIREAGTDMDKGEREKYAKREVEKIMRELG